MMRGMIRAVGAAALIVLVACGGSRGGGKGGKLEDPKLPPANPKALLEFDAGMRAIRLGGPDASEKAEARLREATKLDKNLWEAHLNLGIIYFKDGDDDKAVGSFSKALDINPSAHEARLGRAEAARRGGDRGQARKDYKVLIRERPTTRLYYARLASLHRRRKKYEDGLEVLREALRQAGADTQLYVELALIYLGQGRSELAELVLRRAIALDDKQPAVHNAIALVLLERGKDQAAFERFDYATSLDPKYVDARYNAASVLLDSGDFPRAKGMLEELIAQAPEDLNAKVALGLAHRGIKDFPGAKRVWESVVKSAPRRSRVRADALWNLAVLEADVKMEDVAGKKALERYLQQAPRKHRKRKQAEERLKELGQ